MEVTRSGARASSEGQSPPLLHIQIISLFPQKAPPVTPLHPSPCSEREPLRPENPAPALCLPQLFFLQSTRLNYSKKVSLLSLFPPPSQAGPASAGHGCVPSTLHRANTQQALNTLRTGQRIFKPGSDRDRRCSGRCF